MDRLRSWYAACPRGVEEASSQELEELGAEIDEVRTGGIAFFADYAVAYRILIRARVIVRLYEELGSGTLRDEQDLYEIVADLPWEEWMTTQTTFAVDATIRNSLFRHSGFVGLKAKDAVVDRLRAHYGARPDVDRKEPMVPIKILVDREELRVFRELGGASLHKRGWRPVQTKGPLNEALAAGLLKLSEWSPDEPLVDPMCGSGTFLVEAAWAARRRAPGIQRTHALDTWPDTDQKLLARVREAARAEERELPLRLMGADRHGGALSIARKSIQAAGVEDDIELVQAEITEFDCPWPEPVILTNPPYGERMGEGEDLERTWNELGRFFKRCGGGRAYVLSGDPALSGKLRLKAARRFPVYNGPIDCRLLRYDILPPKKPDATA